MEQPRTKGQVEAAITDALTQFERNYLGRGPREARAFIVSDMVIVRLKGVLSPAEQQLSLEQDGVDLIKKLRSRLVEGSANMLAQIVSDQTGIPVTTMHTDISTRTGERIFVFGLERTLEDFQVR